MVLCMLLQEMSILRRHGHDASTRDAFLEEVGLSEEEWREWVADDARQQASVMQREPIEERSPDDMLEDLIPEKRHFHELHEPPYDPIKLVKEFEHGPYSVEFMLPQHLHVRPCPPSSPWYLLLRIRLGHMHACVCLHACIT
jgi:hypothetical protein